MIQCYDDLTRAVGTDGNHLRISVTCISYHQLHSTFALLDNQVMKKKDGLEIYFVPQDIVQ